MKRVLFVILVSITLSASFSSCKRCKECHTEVFGVKTPPQEYCGEQLEQIKKVQGMVCE